MSPFYAYAIQTPPVNSETFRGYMISFATRDVADEWWRDTRQYADSSLINRVTPQCYTFPRTAALDFSNNTTLMNYNVNSKFKDMVLLIAIAWDRPIVIPDANIRDHINTETFFIRSKRDPSIYWHVDGKGRVEASQNRYSKFRISIQNDDDNTKVMIGSDVITITVAPKAGGSTNADGSGGPCTCNDCICQCSNSTVSVGTNERGDLVASSSPAIFKFRDFKNGFGIESIVTQDDSASATAIVKVDDGEAWELV